MGHPFLRKLVEWPAVARVLSTVERFADGSDAGVLRILTYHRVDAPDPFIRHVEHLATRYHVIPAAAVIAAFAGDAPLPPRSVLLTFDDGYRSFAEVAWPILRARGLPAVLFVPTAYPDSTMEAFWWDRLERSVRGTARREPLATPIGPLPMGTPRERARAHALLKAHVKDLPHRETLATTRAICAALGTLAEPHEVLGWEELRGLVAQGVTLGAHSRTHPRLDRIPASAVPDEILGSMADLEREVPGMPRTFAFPDGRHDDAMVALLRSAGAALAFTTCRGVNDLGRCDPLRLKRLNVDARDSLEVVRARLAATASFLDPRSWLRARPRAAACAAGREGGG